MRYTGIFVSSLLLLASCSGNGASKAQTETIDTAVAQGVEVVELAEGVTSLDETNMAAVREYYEKGVFAFNTDYVKAHSTEEMIRNLCDANEYAEDEGGNEMALWVLCSEAQDGPEDVRQVLGVYPHGEDWYRAELNDMGNKVSVCLRVYEGKIADYSK